ncbi:MAG TPA: EthD family reductase [Mycobacteriales bacterium]|jgi:uncharacterized protein (TIGR02118 family)|nr:EthD family reductase [Mycobacteriales bacterium]
MALYAQPQDAAAFDRHYEATHIKLGLAMPGLRSFSGTHPATGPDGTPAAYHFIAVLTFDDQQSLEAAAASPEGQAAVADFANFAGAGVTLLIGPTTQYL